MMDDDTTSRATTTRGNPFSLNLHRRNSWTTFSATAPTYMFPVGYPLIYNLGFRLPAPRNDQGICDASRFILQEGSASTIFTTHTPSLRSTNITPQTKRSLSAYGTRRNCTHAFFSSSTVEGSYDTFYVRAQWPSAVDGQLITS